MNTKESYVRIPVSAIPDLVRFSILFGIICYNAGKSR